jgi:SAM-dependent methyltransferase
VTASRYDRIGTTYTRTRRPDPRIEARLHAALGDARRVVNVGAGAGSYEPRDRFVVAVEPSAEMLRQRGADTAPAVQGVAEALPFAADAFDAAMASLTLHHWSDVDGGLAELRRVARRQVLFVFEPLFGHATWIFADYFPEMLDLETERNAPTVTDVAARLDVVRVEPVLVPRDCVDGFLGCYWNRPESYLDPDVQAGISCFAQLDADTLSRGMARLEVELDNGTWDAKYGDLRALDEYDLGYRIIVAGF